VAPLPHPDAVTLPYMEGQSPAAVTSTPPPGPDQSIGLVGQGVGLATDAVGLARGVTGSLAGLAQSAAGPYLVLFGLGVVVAAWAVSRGARRR
jgi:hypothetical protein